LLSLRNVSTKRASQKKRHTVTIAATNSVATLWLLPRLRKFNQANKQLNIMLVASDNDAECLADEIDISILRGDGHWPDFQVRKFFGEIVFPICSPAFLAENPNASDLQSLLTLPLIEVSNSHSEWMNWNTWLLGHLPSVPELTRYSMFNAYPHAVQAAVDGLGIALGWGHLVDHLLKSGELVRPLKKTHIRTRFGYYLLEHKSRTQRPECDIVKDWLLSESASRKSYNAGDT
jgi:LysR family glycine cleavage system transcriptional activator